MANSLPYLFGLDLSVAFGEEAANLTPQLIDADVTFVDPDNNYDGGTLVLSGLLAEDSAAIRHQGSGAGQIGVSGANVTFSGTVIGTVSGGTGGAALQVTFNAQATAAAVERLVENLTYQNLSDTPTLSRTLELTITDAAGAVARAPLAMQVIGATPLDGIDAGNYSAPALADVDGDGDLDLVIGAAGGFLNYWQNTGTHLVPAFVRQDGAANPFDGINIGFNSAPSFADLDGDGDLDGVIGRYYGSLLYLRNTGTAIAPAYVAHGFGDSLNPFAGIDIGQYSAPALADLDGDGDLDAMIGGLTGGPGPLVPGLRYYENTGSAEAPSYVLRSGAANPLDGVVFGPGEHPAPAFSDVDDDGDLDAVIGTLSSSSTPLDVQSHYFENTGTAVQPAYVERTGPANPFDSVIDLAPALADLDGDGDRDLVGGESAGTLAYGENIENTYTNLAAANPLNGIDVGYFSAPAFADLDGDGDLDAVVGKSYGTLDYYENTGSAVALSYVLRTGAANPFDAIDLSGTSSPSFADLDGDGDLDAAIGDYDGTLKYYRNTGTAVAPAYLEQTGAANPFNGIDVGKYSMPALADLDGDGDLDAVIGDQIGNLRYYKNTGTGIAPAYVEQTGTANPFDGIGVASHSAPALADMDGDGDLDALVGLYNGTLSYYENIGTGLAPVYAERTGPANPFNGIDVGRYSAPAFADLDGDGDLDAVSGERYGNLKYVENTDTDTDTGAAPEYVEATGGANPLAGITFPGGVRLSPGFADLDSDGDLDVVAGFGSQFVGGLAYFKNTGNALAPAYVLQSGGANPFSGLSAGARTAPAFADLDSDGDLDALVGSYAGTFSYFKNTGTAVAPAYLAQTGAANPFNGLGGGSGASYSYPTFADLNGDGDLDMVSGVSNGTIRYYENTGTATSPSYLLRSGGLNPFNGIDVGDSSTPAFADLDRDGDLDAVIGDLDGPIRYYENTGTGGFRFVVDMITPHADPSEDPDVMHGTAGNDAISSLGGNDTVFGHDGDDTFTGGLGVDSLVGGAGDDVYVNPGADAITELVGGGIDTVTTNTAYTLAPGGQVENLVLTGGASTAGTGNELGNTITGNNGANTLAGLAGNDSLLGGNGTDSLAGGEGDDTLVGGALGDTLEGAEGNDTYEIDQFDSVSESGGDGIDTVLAGFSYGLGIDFENLVLTGGTSINGLGNELNNTIAGNNGSNTLMGMNGNDSLLGGNGTDSLVGGEGNDTLDGGNLNDTMEGGAGDDHYVVNSDTDVVTEGLNAGQDTVTTSVAIGALAANVEEVILDGANGIDVTGNTRPNHITGNSGGNTLAGSGGNDTLLGGEGNDILNGGGGTDELQGGLDNDVYVIGDLLDSIVGEASGPGTGSDLVKASVNFTLATGNNVEKLTLTGTALLATGNELNNQLGGNASGNTLSGGDGNDTLLGMAGDDSLVGGANADFLKGGEGADTMEGGAGLDIFYFVAALGTGVDTISDFDRTQLDKIRLDDAFFAGIGATGMLGDARFAAGSFNDAQDADDRVIYNTDDGTLWFDHDGLDGDAAVHFATLGGVPPPTLAAADIFVI